MCPKTLLVYRCATPPRSFPPCIMPLLHLFNFCWYPFNWINLLFIHYSNIYFVVSLENSLDQNMRVIFFIYLFFFRFSTLSLYSFCLQQHPTNQPTTYPPTHTHTHTLSIWHLKTPIVLVSPSLLFLYTKTKKKSKPMKFICLY